MKKLLNNPVVIGCVAVVAVACVLFTVRKRLNRFVRPVATAVKNQVLTPAEPAPAVASPAIAVDPGMVRPIDRAYARSRVPRWIDSPSRDPFSKHPMQIAVAPAAGPTNAPVPLKVTAIWHQTGKRLAVINSQLVTEGDKVFDYVIDRIENTVVLVRGPLGPERIEFPSFDNLAVARTNRLAGVINPVAKRVSGKPGG